MNFNQRVWSLLKQIPRGKITTYGIIAKKLKTKAYRAVGQACKRNPNTLTTPCHRVVNSNGFVGFYSGNGGMKTKIKLLRQEGLQIEKNRILNFEKVLFRF